MLRVTTLSCVSGTINSCLLDGNVARRLGRTGDSTPHGHAIAIARARADRRPHELPLTTITCACGADHTTPRAVLSPRADYVGQQLPRVSRGTAGEQRPPRGGHTDDAPEAQPRRGTVRQLGAAPSPEARCSGPWVRFSQEARNGLDLSRWPARVRVRLRLVVSDDEDLLPQRVLRPLHLPHRGQSKDTLLQCTQTTAIAIAIATRYKMALHFGMGDRGSKRACRRVLSPVFRFARLASPRVDAGLGPNGRRVRGAACHGQPLVLALGRGVPPHAHDPLQAQVRQG